MSPHFINIVLFLHNLQLLLLTGDDFIAQLSEKIDPSILETSIGGGDARPFNSTTYLQGDFQKDFTALLNDTWYYVTCETWYVICDMWSRKKGQQHVRMYSFEEQKEAERKKR